MLNHDEQDSYYAEQQASVEPSTTTPREKSASEIIADIEYAQQAAARYCRKSEKSTPK